MKNMNAKDFLDLMPENMNVSNGVKYHLREQKIYTVRDLFKKGISEFGIPYGFIDLLENLKEENYVTSEEFNQILRAVEDFAKKHKISFDVVCAQLHKEKLEERKEEYLAEIKKLENEHQSEVEKVKTKIKAIGGMKENYKHLNKEELLNKINKTNNGLGGFECLKELDCGYFSKNSSDFKVIEQCREEFFLGLRELMLGASVRGLIASAHHIVDQEKLYQEIVEQKRKEYGELENIWSGAKLNINPKIRLFEDMVESLDCDLANINKFLEENDNKIVKTNEGEGKV